MDKKTYVYWALTGLCFLAFASAGVQNWMHDEAHLVKMRHLGYPDYFMSILGAAKFVGAFALVWPGTPLLKEWAYAGFTFTLLGAATSHAFASDPIGEILLPLVMLGLAAISYFTRPASRRLEGHATSTPDPA